MKLISRYLIRQLSVMTLYALLALLALYSFFDVVGEIGSVGKGSYGSGTMLLYVLMQIPAHAYELMPLAVLIGGLLALSQLANNSEMTVIKSSGTSTRDIIGILLIFGTLFAFATVLLGELAAPAASRYAKSMRITAKEGSISTGSEGLWMKEQTTIVNVREMMPDHSLRGIKAYRHNEHFQLAETLSAESAQIREDGKWQLHNVRRSVLGDTQVSTESLPQAVWAAEIPANLLDVLLVDPKQMSLMSLGTYIEHLRDNRQKTEAYEIEWWRKLMYPVAAVIMGLVALAFTPQSARHGNMGLKLFFGICLGLAFHFAGRLFGFTGQLYGIPPFIAAALPTLLFAAWATVLIYRQEKR